MIFIELISNHSCQATLLYKCANQSDKNYWCWFFEAIQGKSAKLCFVFHNVRIVL